jgi:hypothetical protein
MPAPVRFVGVNGQRGRLIIGPINLPGFTESIGATLTSSSPPINATSAAAMGSVLAGQGGGAINQHIVNFGGLIGAENQWNSSGVANGSWGTIPANGAASGVGDTNWAGPSYTSDFNSLDLRMQYAVNTGVRKRIITLYSAPFWMLGIDGGPIGYFNSGGTFQSGQWANSSGTVFSTSDPANPLPYFTSSSPTLANMRVQNQYHAAFGSLAAYIAKRYTGQVASSLDGGGPAGSYFAANPLTHMQVWNELKGYYGGIYSSSGISYGNNNYDWVDYIDLYNQIYTQVKAVAPSVKIGGPYAQWVFTPYSETYGPTEAGSVSSTNGAPAQTIRCRTPESRPRSGARSTHGSSRGPLSGRCPALGPTSWPWTSRWETTHRRRARPRPRHSSLSASVTSRPTSRTISAP